MFDSREKKQICIYLFNKERFEWYFDYKSVTHIYHFIFFNIYIYMSNY